MIRVLARITENQPARLRRGWYRRASTPQKPNTPSAWMMISNLFPVRFSEWIISAKLYWVSFA
jgi:hypothetical protein